MPLLSRDFTLGNLASMITTLIAVGTLVWYMSNALAELRGTDALHASRLDRIEIDMKQQKSDHDILIEIRQDLRVLRTQVEQALPRRLGGTP